MPMLCKFLGIYIYMVFNDKGRHNQPHLHAKCGGKEVVVSLDGKILAGSLPKNKLRSLLVWMRLHTDELHVNWQLAKNLQPFNKIKPL